MHIYAENTTAVFFQLEDLEKTMSNFVYFTDEV